MDERPKTLAEMAAEAQAAGDAVGQWRCPRCGGRQWWVRNSRFKVKDGSRHRTRECRGCHYAIRTIETVDSSIY